MQFWCRPSRRPRIGEVPVKLIYNDPNRTFGGPLNDAQTRLRHYRRVLHCELEPAPNDCLPELTDVDAGCGCG